MALLELRHITRRFGSLEAVKEVSLGIEASEFFTLLGPSGCGKTTILRMIAGFDAPDEGDILLDGQSLDGVPPEKRPLHTVFQSYALFPHMTVAGNVAFPLEMARESATATRRRAAEVADYVMNLQISGIKDTTIDNKYLPALSGFFKTAVKHEAWPREMLLPTANQRNLKKNEREEATEPYLPFDLDELRKIFSPATLLAQKIPHQFWLPLLGLFTGARLNELCQLAITDVRQMEGHWAISIDDEEYKKVKNTASRRTIPLHPQLIELGFLDYLEDVRAGKGERVFPYLTQDRYGSFIKTPSANFAKYLDLPAVGISHPRKVFHSFRSTANNALKHAGVVEEERCEMVGHEHPTVNHLHYSEAFMVSYLLDKVIPKFAYPGLDLSGLKYERGRFAATLGRKMQAHERRQNHLAAKQEREANVQAEAEKHLKRGKMARR